MLTEQPTMTTLFDQLGLESSDDAIERFFERYHLEAEEDVSEADFLSFEQRLALARMRDEDAEWAELVDTMEQLLHRH
ncbi:MAG: DUF2789 domain-containing protein [Saccharospirillum sp.]|nr:DUF2789 domain-containing protein [Saccharospirillum sp.]